MLTIIAATKTTDFDEKLNALLQRWDAASDIDRPSVESEIMGLLKPKVRSMLRNKLKGLIDPSELEEQTENAISRALEEAGVTRTKRTDATVGWEPLVERMRNPDDPVGSSLWPHLSDGLRAELENATYLKSPLEQRLAEELSQLIAREDLPEMLGQPVPGGGETRQDLTEQNALMLQRLFPEAGLNIQRPKRNILGYIGTFVVPELKKDYLEEAGKPTEHQRNQWRAIKPYYDELLAATGLQPDATAVHEKYREGLEAKYGPVRKWWEEQVKKARPEKPFAIKNPPALRDAKQLLENHGYDKTLWQDKQSPYYLPKEYLKPMSLQSIQRIMSLMMASPQGHASRPLSRQPASPATVPAGPASVPWAVSPQGGGPELYRQTINQLYSEPQFGAERAVGEFLGQNPSPDAEQIEQFVSTLPPDIAEDIRQVGWDNLSREIDQRVLEQVTGPSAVSASAHAIDQMRRIIFGRNVRRLVRLAMAG